MDVAERSRSRLIVARWLSLALCGTVAAAVNLLVEGLLGDLGAPIADRLAHTPPSATLALVGVLLGACCWASGRGRWRGFVGLSFLFGYPPLWVSVAFGISVWAAGRAWISDADPVTAHLADIHSFASQVPLEAWYAVGAVLLAGFLSPLFEDAWRFARRRWGAASRRTKKPATITHDIDTLRQWLRDDKEIRSPDADRFDHDAIAERICDRLMDPEEAPTMAVIGPLGSGKTTVRRLVQHRLRDQRRICIVAISLWPFDSPEAAVRGILRALVRTLSEQVNVLSLVGLSGDYVAAIERAAGSYGGVARLLRGASDPTTIVQKFSDIAGAAGFRVVIWVEDLERFSGGDQLEGPPRDEREAERLGAIRALLHLLDRSEQVSVVVSDVSLRTRFDLGKIVRFIEQIPPMERSGAWRAVELLRTACLGNHPISTIDPAAPEARETLKLDTESHPTLSWLSTIGARLTIPEAAVRVLKTPRALKSALRVALETWEAMPGEIDFDAVLITSVLRTARPGLFALVAEHIDLFRHGFANPLSADAKKDKLHPVVNRVHKLLAREAERDGVALKALLSYLFPKYPPGGDANDREYVDRPQALFVERHADYWRRYLAQTEVPEPQSDQRALASIRAWQADKTSDLVERVADPNRSDQIETFIGQFKAAELRRLLTELADRLSRESASEWHRRSEAPGVTALWRMMLTRRPREEEVFDTVRDIVQRIAPTHLPLAHDISHYFAASSPEVPTLMSEPQRGQIRSLLGSVLLAQFTGEGAEDRLALAVRDGSPWIISWVAWGVPRIRAGDRSELPFDEWAKFAHVLLNLAERRPELGVPLVVPFVTRGNMAREFAMNDEGRYAPSSRWVGEFDQDAAKRLFEFDRLIRILAEFQVPPTLDDQIRAQGEAAVEAAKRIAIEQRTRPRCKAPKEPPPPESRTNGGS